MQLVSFKRHRFPPVTADVLRRAVWFYCGFTPGFRDVEEMLPAPASA
jgi:transposase-like protein